MSLSTPYYRLFVFIALYIPALPVHADFDERYRLDIGSSIYNFDANITINSRDDSVGKEIDLEDGFGFDPQVQQAIFKGSWRVADHHRLSLLYLPIRRTGKVITAKDIEVASNIVKAGATIDATTRTHVFDFEYIYSFYKQPNLELGVSAGIYWMNSATEVAASGRVIQDGTGDEVFRSDFRANQSLIAPLPLFGLGASYEINSHWQAHANVRYFDVTINDIEGRITSFNLKTEYYFTDHFAVGASLASFDLKVKQSGVVFFNTLGYGYNGLDAYIALKY